MIRKTAASAVIATTVLVLALAALVSKGAAPAPAPAEDTEFQGKVLWVVMKTAANTMLQDVRVTRVGGRAFLAGTTVLSYDDEDGAPQVTVYLPVDDVKGMSVFSSKGEAKKVAQWGAKRRGSGGDSPLPQPPSSPPSDKQ